MMGLLRARVRHPTFLIYHPDDRAEVDAVADFFDHNRDVLIHPCPGIVDDLSLGSSGDEGYILRRIRGVHMQRAAVSAVLVGHCTWASRHVDWAIKAALLPWEDDPPHGLFGMVLPSARKTAARLPLRLQANLGSGYARLHPPTYRVGTFARYIREAYQGRARQAAQVANQQALQEHDMPCQ
jgi:hypothetical protein